jgi:hypothetical protein
LAVSFSSGEAFGVAYGKFETCRPASRKPISGRRPEVTSIGLDPLRTRRCLFPVMGSRSDDYPDTVRWTRLPASLARRGSGSVCGNEFRYASYGILPGSLRFFFRGRLRRSDIIEHTTFVHEPRKLRPGHESNMLSPQLGDLPVGRLVERGVQPHSKKYFGFRTPQITSRTFRVPPHRGACHDRHERGVGCGGRGSVLRAMGSRGGFLGTCERSPARGREMLLAYGKIVWS